MTRDTPVNCDRPDELAERYVQGALGEDEQAAFEDHYFECARLAQEVGREHLDRRCRALRADRADHGGEMRRAAIVEIVAID